MHSFVLFYTFWCVLFWAYVTFTWADELTVISYLQEPREEWPIDQQHSPGQVSSTTAPSHALSSTAKGQTQSPDTQYLCACSHTKEEVFMTFLCVMFVFSACRCQDTVAQTLVVSSSLMCPFSQRSVITTMSPLEHTARKQEGCLLPSPPSILHQPCQPRHRHQRTGWST